MSTGALSGGFIPPAGAGGTSATIADEAAKRQARLAPLVAGMAQADEAALAAFYDATAAKVHGLVLRICHDAALAEEVVADTFFQAWTDSARYEPSRGKVMTWLLTIARSRTIDALRRRDEALVHEAPETLQHPDDERTTGSVEALLVATESDATIGALLAQLTPVQRQMIALAFCQGLSHGEIASHSGVPIGTVKSHIRRALAALRGALEQGGINE